MTSEIERAVRTSGPDAVLAIVPVTLSAARIWVDRVHRHHRAPQGGLWQHEPLWYAVRNKTTAHWIGGRSETTIWDINYDAVVLGNHAAQKPVECMERPIRNHEGDVYDPFVGSGTTILAAERQNRTCYAMEIDPGYVDAAVKRWEAYTGEKGVRDGS